MNTSSDKSIDETFNIEENKTEENSNDINVSLNGGDNDCEKREESAVDVPEKSVENEPNDAPENTPEKVIESISENASDEIVSPEKSTEVVSEYICENIQIALQDITYDIDEYISSKKTNYFIEQETIVKKFFEEKSITDLKFAFDYNLAEPKKLLLLDAGSVDFEHLWFIGDVHGDILALVSAIKYIDSQDDDATIIFTGDLIDRYAYSYEVLIFVLNLIISRQNKILWIAGNHDIGLSYDETENKFVSNVIPSEFSEWLNVNPLHSELVRKICQLIARLPVAVLLPDGTLAVHGGVPGNMLQTTLAEQSDFQSDEIIYSFIVNRLHPEKIRARGTELGWQNVENFSEIFNNIFNRKICRIVRGHDHYEYERHRFYEQYEKIAVLTMVTLSAWSENELYFKNISGNIRTLVCVSKARENKLPLVKAIELPIELIEKVHGNDV